jgi:hypothetical protein
LQGLKEMIWLDSHTDEGMVRNKWPSQRVASKRPGK